MPFKAFLYMH